MKRRKCRIVGCDRNVAGNNLCLMHYKRWWKYGSPHTTLRPYRNPPNCAVRGCVNTVIAKGLCGNHYALNKRHGEPVRKKLFVGWYIKDGYKYVMVGKRHYEPEHRVVMERFLGRKLKSQEHVHHEDENKLNNSPSNLRVLSRSEHMRIHRTGKH